MTKQATARSEKSGSVHKLEHRRNKKDETAERASWPRVTAGVAAAAGGGLLAAAVLGVGPAAIAGVAGYIAYRGLSEEKKAS
jgi:hypothetical protein